MGAVDDPSGILKLWTHIRALHTAKCSESLKCGRMAETEDEIGESNTREAMIRECNWKEDEILKEEKENKLHGI
jgi:hypothetical protein